MCTSNLKLSRQVNRAWKFSFHRQTVQAGKILWESSRIVVWKPNTHFELWLRISHVLGWKMNWHSCSPVVHWTTGNGTSSILYRQLQCLQHRLKRRRVSKIIPALNLISSWRIGQFPDTRERKKNLSGTRCIFSLKLLMCFQQNPPSSYFVYIVRAWKWRDGATTRKAMQLPQCHLQPKSDVFHFGMYRAMRPYSNPVHHQELPSATHRRYPSSEQYKAQGEYSHDIWDLRRSLR